MWPPSPGSLPGEAQERESDNKQERHFRFRAPSSVRFGGAALRPSVPWRRPASDRESDVKLPGSVMKRDMDQFPVAAQHHPCAATRASERIALYPPLSKGRFRGVPEAKDRVSARESGRRRPSFATRARLQREAVESSTMEGGETPSFAPSSGPVVWRHGQRLVWVASRESTNQSGDVRPASRSLLCREATMSRGTNRSRVKGK